MRRSTANSGGGHGSACYPRRVGVHRSHRARHLAGSAQGLEGRLDCRVDRAARRPAGRLCRRQRLAEPRSGERRIPPRHIHRPIRLQRAKRWSTPRLRPSGPMCPDRATGCSRRRGLPMAASSSSIAVSCRTAGRTRRSRADGQIAGPVELSARMRWPDARHWFTPNDDPRITSGSPAIRRPSPPRRELAPVAPFYIEQEAPVPPGGLPQPGKLVVVLPDNHLQYAITWYRIGLGPGRCHSWFGL